MTNEKAARLAAIRATNAAKATQACADTRAAALPRVPPLAAATTQGLLPPPPPLPVPAQATASLSPPAAYAHKLVDGIDNGAPALALETVIMVLLAVIAGALAATMLLPAWLPGLSASLLGSEPKAYWYLARSSGLVAYLMLWLSMLLGLSMRSRLAHVWPGGPTTFDLHQHTSLLGLALALFHGLILLGDRYIGFTLVMVLLPFAATDATSVWVGVGQVAFYLLTVVGLSFYVRNMIGRKVWRRLHFVSFATFLLALFHGLGSGTDSAAPLGQALYWLSGASVLFFTVYRVLVHPAQAARV
jgi:hypothetical protein